MLPPVDDPRRVELREWFSAHPAPTGRELAERGLVAPHWPAPYGLGADPTEQLLVDEELRRAGVRRPENTIGIGWAGPTLMHAGTEEQKERYLLPLLAADEIWCQLFSEPGAGFGILLPRTEPDAAKHQGISYFVCPMDAPGITVRPLYDMTGAHTFNEVFLDEVRLPRANLVGERGQGWSLAKVTLANERVSLSGAGALWGMGPTVDALVDAARAAGGVRDPLLRQRLVGVWTEGEILRLLRLRTVSAAVAGAPPGPEASVRKALADEHGQHIMDLARDLAGAAGMLAGSGPFPGTPDAGGWPDAIWPFGFLFSPALTIGGGTSEVQRNIIAERTLGLPHDPAV